MRYLHEIDPIAFGLGNWNLPWVGSVHPQVHWYGIMYLLGFLAAWWLGRHRIRAGRLPGVDETGFGDLMFYCMLGVVLGGRIGYILFYDLKAYIADPLQVLQIWKGGMSFHGGLLGVVAATWWWSRKQRLQLFDVVDFIAPDRLRAYARFDKTRLKPGLSSGELLGHGHLAMTIDQGPDMSRYQGLVALQGGSLEDAAHEYFLRSEQIPTRVRLAVGEELRGGSDGPKHRWRGGGALIQFLPKAPERAKQADLHPGDAPEGSVSHVVEEDDAWTESQSLFATIEDVELIDPDLSGERLLFRLFHKRGVRVFPSLPLHAGCTCSRDAVAGMLASFDPEDRADMVEDGKVVVTCEFCSSIYEFTPQEAGVED